MSSSDDHRDHPKTLPSPELNPLMNPVLGRNMGRWAEVYFTNPPEKREQAVQELLRVLERESPGAAASEHTSPAWTESNQLSAESRPSTAGNRPLISARGEELIQCGACGRVALAEQKFCGSCGAPLRPREPEVAAEPSEVHEQSNVQKEAPEGEDRPAVADSASPGFDSASPGFDSASPVSSVASASQDFNSGSEASEKVAAPALAELPAQFASVSSQDVPTQDVPRLFQGAPHAHFGRSRRTMAVAFAILVLTLFYVAAKETASWLRDAHKAQQAAMAASSASARPSSVPAVAVQPEPAAPVASEHGASPAESAESTPRLAKGKNTAEAESSTTATSSRKPVQTANTGDKNPSPSASPGSGAVGPGAAGSGAEELAVAESYLSGTQGKTRDSAQAAQWLWKAVGKQNGAAALLLSDLYVTGDGVPQNCDQARLLLNAAASKKIPGAGERIRDLPNLGCK